MAELLKSTLGTPIAVANTLQTLYTAPTVVDATLVNIKIHNKSASVAGTYSVHHVPNGGTASVDNRIVHLQPIDPNENQAWDDRIFLATGDTIQIVGSTTNLVFKANLLERTA